MSKTTFSRVLAGAFVALVLAVPIYSYASHNASKIDVLKAEIQAYKHELARLNVAPDDGNNARAIRLLEEEIRFVEEKLSKLEAEDKKSASPVHLKLGNRGLQRGSSGNDVKQLQELLGKFPDVYPEGLATGYFGQLTEKAIKALQKGLNLEQVGMVGPKTRDKLGQIASAVGRKERPHIDEISPNSVSLGDMATISGNGFTFEKNYLFVRGKLVLKDLVSADGSSIDFPVPPNIPCAIGQACPVKIANKNGISNAKPFKLAEPSIPPEPQPTPTPVPTPTPPEPQITAISPSYGQAGTEVTLLGTGFALANNSVNFGGLSSAVTGLASTDQQTLKFNVPASSCQPLAGCAVSVINAGGTSNTVTFTLTQPITPVIVASPNGGEKFVQGANSVISWQGGTDIVRIALVEESAAKGSDPSPMIVGWIATTALPNSSFAWDAKQVCDESGAVCAPVASGAYKILAVSEDELGKVAIGMDGSGNWDVSDNAFGVLPTPSVAVVAPNGGEKLIYGSDAVISWNATSIISNQVAIKLFKGGVFLRTIYAGFTQSTHTGIFYYAWTVPSDLVMGSDYSIEVSDTANPTVRDISDATFTIAPKSTITVTVPNGGGTWFSGFQGLVRWNSGNIFSKSVNINLLKGGVFYRRLATSILQKFYSWQTTGYTSGTGFNAYVSIPADIPDDSDYAIEITDATDAATRDASDAAFIIQAVPSPVTLYGRLVGKFSGTPYPNQYLYSHAYYGPNLPQWSATPGKTDSDGRFSVATTTNESFVLKIPVGGWPNCASNWSQFLYKYPENIIWMNHLFDLLPDAKTILSQSEINLGDVPIWPMTGLYTYTDKPGIPNGQVNYADSSYGGWQILALEADLQVKFYENTGTGSYAVHTSPSVRISLANGCAPKTLTFLGGIWKWEPYNVRSSTYLRSATVGVPIKIASYPSGGVAPYTWGLYFGSLPPGLTLDPITGLLSGTPTMAGTYRFQIRTTDTNGVNGGTWPITVTVQ